ncbi:Domain of unknown function DUF559 [uncultured Caudovirales phage]|uniref:DUF559 domain-containing protein n=1 Tax=uncultured Caudovirales phage TaxID=2100421 RepID=A0A6J7X746_9CAUD|nr:Domain of unknown function DUF559 [uncultured Caudovirales phage]
MNVRTIECLNRYKNIIKKRINQGHTAVEIAVELKVDVTRIYTDIKRFGSEKDFLLLRHNVSTSLAMIDRVEKAKRNLINSNYSRVELARDRFNKIIKPLIWSGMTTIDIKKQLNLKTRSAIAKSVEKYGTLRDVEQLKHNGIIKKRDALVRLMKNKTSKPEIMLYNIVKLYYPGAQHKFKILSDKQYYWELDVVVPEIKLNFEYDGYYWHKDNKQRDDHRDSFLKKQGWRVFRFNYSKSPTLEELERDFRHRVLSQLK